MDRLETRTGTVSDPDQETSRNGDLQQGPEEPSLDEVGYTSMLCLSWSLSEVYLVVSIPVYQGLSMYIRILSTAFKDSRSIHGETRSRQPPTAERY
jgi:hypothetical protein